MVNETITVVIPTYNRISAMKKFVDECVAGYSGALFKFEIHDSSLDKSLESYVKSFNKIKYFNYDYKINGDVKTIQAIQNVDTPYVYLLGDGYLVDFNRLEELLGQVGLFSYWIIGVMPRGWHISYQKVLKKYSIINGAYFTNNYLNFFNDFFWYLTLYGGSIVRKELCGKNDISERLINDNSPFVYVTTVFSQLDRYRENCAMILLDNIMVDNPYKGQSGWMKAKKAIEIFCCKYYKSVILLPKSYAAHRRAFLISHNKYSGLFTCKSILLLRMNGNITFSILKKYRVYATIA